MQKCSVCIVSNVGFGNVAARGQHFRVRLHSLIFNLGRFSALIFALTEARWWFNTPYPPQPLPFLLPMHVLLHTIDTNDGSTPSLEYGSSPVASEAVYVPNVDGSSSIDSCRNTWYVDQSTLTTHPSRHLFHHPFVPRPYTSHWRDYCRYCNGWGWFGGTTSIFVDKSYTFYIRMRVDLGQYNILWHKPTPTIHHTTIKWGRSAVPMRGWQCGVDYLRYQARFSIFWCIKNEVIFHLFLYW